MIGDSNQISKKRVQKGGKRSYEGFRGMIIFAYSGQGTKPKPRPGLPASWSPQVPVVDPTMLDAYQEPPLGPGPGTGRH